MEIIDAASLRLTSDYESFSFWYWSIPICLLSRISLLNKKLEKD